MPFDEVIWTMANCWLLGWKDAGLQLYDWTIRGLDQLFFIDAGTYGSRRAHYFCLRLLSAYLGREQTRTWPPFALDEPIYEFILSQWRTPNADSLRVPILAACDRHTHQARQDTNKQFYDFRRYPQMYQPFEVLLLLRLRQWEHLSIPTLDHPLLETPLGRLPDEVPEYTDDLLQSVVARAEKDCTAG